MINLKKITSLLLTVLLVTSIFTSVIYAEKDSTELYKAAIEKTLYKAFEDGFSQYYKINDISVKFDDVTITDGKLEANVLAKMNKTLLAKSVEELPYVKGMLKKANMKDFKHESKAKTDEAVYKANKDKLSNDKIAYISKEIDFRLSYLEQYINKPVNGNYYLKVTADVNDGTLDTNSIRILAENVDEYVPFDEMLPESEEQIEQEGLNDMQAVINSEDEGFKSSLYASYSRVDAVDYANMWTGVDVTDCDVHGTSCGIYQDRAYWNTDTYPYYAELLHNDCADFVSQCLNAGGIPMDSTWKRGATGTPAWVNVSSLKSYMVNKGYWTSATISTCLSGGVIFTSSSHVVMCVENDSITKYYTGHTNDRVYAPYTNPSGWVYYKLW